jgi:L-methionine (R)-S-oxide reductase
MDEEKERALADVAAAVAGGGDRAAILRAVTARLRRLPGYTGVYLYALEGDVLVLRAHAGRDTEHVRIPIGAGLCGLSARTGEAVLVDDVAADPRYLACNVETRSELVVPITLGGRYLAQIDVDSDDRAAFGDADRELLARVATLLAPLLG